MTERGGSEPEPIVRIAPTPDYASTVPAEKATSPNSDPVAPIELTQEQQERAVGITAFVSPDAPGFSCTVKQRYTDFLVNEILPHGEVLHLTELVHQASRKERRQQNGQTADEELDTEATSAAAETQLLTQPEGAGANSDLKRKRDDLQEDEAGAEVAKKPKTELEEDGNNVNGISTVSEEDRAALQTIFGEITTKGILSLWRAVSMHGNRKAREYPTVKSEVISEKSQRTEAHVAVRKFFDSKLRTEMLQDEPGVIAIRAAPRKGAESGRGQQNGSANGPFMKGKQGWDELGGEYLHFTLYKENKDTMEVLYFIASQLKVKLANFAFAGTKDRRGVTVQRVCAYRVHADRIKGLMKVAKGWRVGEFVYKKHGLELGESAGNEFLLTLRDCCFGGDDFIDEEQRLQIARKAVSDAAAKFKVRGFINYYGLQRFGTFSTGTHIIGMKMLKGDLGGAVNSILSYPPALLPENQYGQGESKVPQDDIRRADAIRTWREIGNTAKALGDMPKRFQAESSLIQYLSKKDKKTGRQLQDRDFQGALMQIQRNLRLMYVHAYQSLVWNAVASRRWETYGDKVMEGDLVIIGGKDGGVVAAQDEADEDGEPVFRPAPHDTAASADGRLTKARPLSTEEAASGKFAIFDIVLPLPGHGIVYPANETAKFYVEFMASDAGGGLDPHNMRRSWKDISLFGDYRKMMARPGKDLAVEVKTYRREDEQMVETDLERLQRAESGELVDASNSNGSAQNQTEGAAERTKLGVVLKMQLGTSQYATMALRELTMGGAAAYKPEFSTQR